MNLKRCLCLMVRLFLPHAILGIHLFLCHDHVADRSVTIAGLFLGYDQIFIQSEISRADIDLFASLETPASLIWLHGQTKSIIGDDEMETWSICFVAELVSTPCYISTILIPLKCLLFILIGTVANVPNIGQLLVRIYFTKSSAYLPSWKLLFIFLVSSRGCRDAEF